MSNSPENYLDEFDKWVSRIKERLAKGQAEYGDKSLEASPGGLVREIEEEAVDIPAWTYILWRRLMKMQRATAGMTEWEPQDGLRALGDRGDSSAGLQPAGGPSGTRQEEDAARPNPLAEVAERTVALSPPPVIVEKPEASPRPDLNATKGTLPGWPNATNLLEQNVRHLPKWRSSALAFEAECTGGPSPSGALQFKVQQDDEVVIFWVPFKLLNPGTTALAAGQEGIIVLPEFKAREKGLRGGERLT